MQIGNRWRLGATPPSGLPAEFLRQLAAAEATASAQEREQWWTLTWLEGRPIARLDGGRRVGDADDTVEDDEDLFPAR